NHGCCSWKPQPSARPAARSPSTSAPIAANAVSTPSVYHSACERAAARLSPLCARPTTLSERIGSTHGIRLSNRPPSSPSANAPISPPVGSAGAVLRTALSAEASVLLPAGAAAFSAGGAPASGAAAGSGSAWSCPVPDAAGPPTGGGAAVEDAGPSAVTVPAGSDTCTRRVIGG